MTLTDYLAWRAMETVMRISCCGVWKRRGSNVFDESVYARTGDLGDTSSWHYSYMPGDLTGR